MNKLYMDTRYLSIKYAVAFGPYSEIKLGEYLTGGKKRL